jgi:hypothetical protein
MHCPIETNKASLNSSYTDTATTPTQQRNPFTNTTMPFSTSSSLSYLSHICSLNMVQGIVCFLSLHRDCSELTEQTQQRSIRSINSKRSQSSQPQSTLPTTFTASPKPQICLPLGALSSSASQSPPTEATSSSFHHSLHRLPDRSPLTQGNSAQSTALRLPSMTRMETPS